MTLVVGDKAPNFTLPSASGELVTLASLLSERTVVLFFYPKDGSPGCTAEACSFRDQNDAFVEAGAEVVGISADSVASHERFAGKLNLRSKLLSDAAGKVAALYRVRGLLGLLPGRATFVIDRTGIIQHVFASQLRFRSHADEALKVVKRLQSSPASVALST